MTRLQLAIKSVDAERGTFSAIASTSQVDRDGESIAAYALLPLPASVPVADGHGGELVARAVPRYEAEGERLVIEGAFASTPRAQVVRTLVKEAILDSVSIVFLRKESAMRDGIRVTTRGELLGADLVSMPSNPGALVLAARSFGGGTAESAVAACKNIANDALIEMARLDLKDAQRFLADHPPTDGPGMRAWLFDVLRDI